MTSSTIAAPATLEWIGGTDGFLRLIDQRRLPTELVYLDCRDLETVYDAIKTLAVRGAPAIGIAAAYGVCVGLQSGGKLDDVVKRLASSRPTAVNLFWALDRMQRVARETPQDQWPERLLVEAKAIHDEDRRMCRAIGANGAPLLKNVRGALTHCNAGGLAASEYGMALALFFAAHEAGERFPVYVDETRPLLQGSRLTAWELQRAGIKVTLICDSMAAQVMREGRVQAVVTGADRITAGGDTANKIGTYGLAVLAHAHDIPFYIAAPSSTFDLSLASGDQIPIEERAAVEITHGFGRQTAPDGVGVYNPAFDVTPARLIRAIVCEKGVISPVTRENIARVIGGA